MPTATRQWGSVLQEVHCPLPPRQWGNGAVYCRSLKTLRMVAVGRIADTQRHARS